MVGFSISEMTVILGAGYCEDAHLARLILNRQFPEGSLTPSPQQIAKEFYELLCEFVAQDIREPRKCCKGAKKGDNFCSKCGQSLVDAEDGFLCRDQVAELFRVMVTETQDGIASHCQGCYDLYGFMYDRGWDQNGNLVSGPVVEIAAFDHYILDPTNRVTEFKTLTLEARSD